MTYWVMLDTNTVSYIVTKYSNAVRLRLEELGSGKVACMSAVTEAELLYGVAKLSVADLRVHAVLQFLAGIRVMPWGSREARVYGPLRLTQDRLGKPIGNLDLLIAAHAISLNATLVTADKAFSQVSGLRSVENWATDLP